MGILQRFLLFSRVMLLSVLRSQVDGTTHWSPLLHQGWLWYVRVLSSQVEWLMYLPRMCVILADWSHYLSLIALTADLIFFYRELVLARGLWWIIHVCHTYDYWIEKVTGYSGSTCRSLCDGVSCNSCFQTVTGVEVPSIEAGEELLWISFMHSIHVIFSLVSHFEPWTIVQGKEQPSIPSRFPRWNHPGPLKEKQQL